MSARLQSVEGRFQEGVAIGVLRGTIGAYAHVWGPVPQPARRNWPRSRRASSQCGTLGGATPARTAL